ncbi:choice-of-anchor U domain-containing protein, partial [Verminephrobacter aporrectodeae]|uniref:choice-of-anchor U domain-containing protein n=1 Tax=Verminephrobacter aporrectodeae TaxID=1110389 RepID=UPI00224348E4
PVAGDGNGDGVQDGTQAAVGSTSARVRSTGESAASTPVTLVAGSQDGKVDPDSGARITRLAQEDAPAQWPDGMEMPLGLLSFRATLAAGRSSEKFSLYLDPALGVNGYWMQDGSGTWINLSSAAYGGKMVSEGGRLRLDFEISDGGPFDADGQANGAITAPGAPAQMQLSVVGLASDLAPNGFWL